MTSTVYTPPEYPKLSEQKLKIFLAGTIDMGESINWQREIYEMLIAKYNCLDIFNPRRPDWDISWEQKASNVHFRKQVEWELDHLEKSDLILMVLLKDSKSPISLMELGAYKDKPMFVYCPDEFYRKGNVDIFCKRNSILVMSDWEEYIHNVKVFVYRWITCKVPVKLQN